MIYGDDDVEGLHDTEYKLSTNQYQPGTLQEMSKAKIKEELINQDLRDQLYGWEEWMQSDLPEIKGRGRQKNQSDAKEAMSASSDIDGEVEDGAGAAPAPDYVKRLAFWRKQPSNVVGMFKGWKKLSKPDIAYQRKFFCKYKHLLPGNEYCLELFGGIGRVYYLLLRHYFKRIDFNELVEEHLKKAVWMSKIALKKSKGLTGKIKNAIVGPAEQI